MPQSIIDEPTVALDRYDGNIFVITMRKAPENRINSAYAQKLINIFGEVRRILGKSTEGAVITKGNDAKFFTTVRFIASPLVRKSISLEEMRTQSMKSIADIESYRVWNWMNQTQTHGQTRTASSLCWLLSWTSRSLPSLWSPATPSAAHVHSPSAMITE